MPSEVCLTDINEARYLRHIALFLPFPLTTIIVAYRLPTLSPISISGQGNSSGYIVPVTAVMQMKAEAVVEFGCDYCKRVKQALYVDLDFITHGDHFRASRESFGRSGAREAGSTCQLGPYTFRLLV